MIEAHLDHQRGIAATLLIRDGTLRKGDLLAAGKTIETIKILEDFQGRPIVEAGPSSPVRVVGLSEMPGVGDFFQMHASKREAENYVKTLPVDVSPEKGTTSASEEKIGKPVFNIILKADVAGSREALE